LVFLDNHNAALRGLHTFVQRRQSFAFLRSTLTDMSSLKIRLSLGLEPDIFADVVVASIKQLNVLIKEFNFTKGTNSENDLVKQASAAFERPRGAKATEKTGNYLRGAMRSLDDQWASFLVAQKYLQEQSQKDEGDVNAKNKAAFEEYLQEFVIARCNHEKTSEPEHKSITRYGYSFENKSEVKSTETREEKEILQNNVVFQLLQNIINKTINKILSLKDIPESYSYYYILQKLLHNCEKGIALLAHLGEYEITHLYAKANLLIEEIGEYLIPLKALTDKQANADSKEDDITKLSNFEKKKITETLGVEEKQIHLFYNDSGQQAATLGIIAMSQQCMTDRSNQTAVECYLFENSYFEIADFIKKDTTAVTQTKNQNQANIWFTDITNIELLENMLEQDEKSLDDAEHLQAVIIDITNNSSKALLSRLKPVTDALLKKGIWVELVCSSLKHEELGLDKYQSGKTIILAPDKKKKLDTTVNEQLTAISQAAMPQLVASFRNLVTDVLQEQKSAVAKKMQAKTKVEEQIKQVIKPGKITIKKPILIKKTQPKTKTDEHTVELSPNPNILFRKPVKIVRPKIVENLTQINESTLAKPVPAA
jgi:hypothetical protein